MRTTRTPTTTTTTTTTSTATKNGTPNITAVKCPSGGVTTSPQSRPCQGRPMQGVGGFQRGLQGCNAVFGEITSEVTYTLVTHLWPHPVTVVNKDLT